MRVPPKLATHQMQTYTIAQPARTHFTVVSCEAFGCPAWLGGFEILADEATDLGRAQAAYLRSQKDRVCVESRRDAGMTVFTFPAGTVCYQTHRVRNDRPELFIVRGGDWRGNPTGQTRTHANADDWQEDFAQHQDELAKAQD